MMRLIRVTRLGFDACVRVCLVGGWKRSESVSAPLLGFFGHESCFTLPVTRQLQSALQSCQSEC